MTEGSDPDKDLTHHEIAFKNDAFVWSESKPVRANVHPFAGEIADWMEQKGLVNYFIESDKEKYTEMYTNPFTFSVSTLSLCWQAIVNEAHKFATSTENDDFVDTEVKYIRMRSELLIYGSRLVEAIIKQLLHCTSFPRKHYKRATLGKLIAFDCKPCRTANIQTHKVSMLGSVGHRYGLCHGYEKCLNEQIRELALNRNKEGAHAGITPFQHLPASEAKTKMMEDLMNIGNNVHHVLRHLRDYETRMIAELNSEIRIFNVSIVEFRIPIEESNDSPPETKESPNDKRRSNSVDTDAKKSGSDGWVDS